MSAPYRIPSDRDECDALNADDSVSLCWGHGMVEPVTDGAFLCYECGHVYEAEPDADFCEVCIHDF